MPHPVNLNEYKEFCTFYKQWSLSTQVAEDEPTDAKFQRPTPELFVDDLAGSAYRLNQPIQTAPRVTREAMRVNQSSDPYVRTLQGRSQQKRTWGVKSAGGERTRVVKPLAVWDTDKGDDGPPPRGGAWGKRGTANDDFGLPHRGGAWGKRDSMKTDFGPRTRNASGGNRDR